ncbi:Ig-like V-type domain-containing protein FAM187A [Chanos chanos]|uniref:Ig-like V-type domain-containing protein FAM187A n=1 Tax=Chanos chanos TaxID=29144 RepID=A0A6J2W3R9_CHACN|nr:Ig-like V-type domain-containing protein FAM187A [Chanos chanos]
MRVLSLWLWTLCPSILSAYVAPDEKEDVFAQRVCPAFLVFNSAAYLADTTIELPCHCKPEKVLSVVWYYQKHLGSHDTKVLTDFAGKSVVDSSKVSRGSELHSRFSIRLFSLLILRVQRADSGHYLCGSASGEFFYGYDVDVQEVHHVFFMSPAQRVPTQATHTRQPRLFQVFTSYQPWSTCDRCGAQGEQMRAGLCYVLSDYLRVRYGHMARRVASCGSFAVPQHLGLSSSGHGALLEVRNCHSLCSSKPKILQRKLTLLEFMGYGEPASPEVPVYYYNHPLGSPLILSCPGAKTQHAVAWDKGSTPLYRSQYMEGLNKSSRMFIDTGHHLHFSPALLEDRGPYFCWLQGQRVAEIRLGVYLHLGHLQRTSVQDSLYALKTILICYLGLSAVFLLVLFVRFSWRKIKDKTSYLT